MDSITAREPSHLAERPTNTHLQSSSSSLAPSQGGMDSDKEILSNLHEKGPMATSSSSEQTAATGSLQNKELELNGRGYVFLIPPFVIEHWEIFCTRADGFSFVTLRYIYRSQSQQGTQYVSPSDDIMSPCTKKLSDLKGKRFKK